MYSDFPPLPLVQEVPPMDLEEHKSQCTSGDVIEIEKVFLHFPALTALLHHGEKIKGRSIFGRIFGVQVGSCVEITEVVANPLKKATPYGEDSADRDRENIVESFKHLAEMHQGEKLEQLQVGIFAISNARSNTYFYNRPSLIQLAELSANLLPDVLLTYDAQRTLLFGKPFIRAFVLTTAYKNYQNELKRVNKNNTEKPHEILKKMEVMKRGIFREVPVSIAVDAFHTLNTFNIPVHPLPSCLEIIEKPAVGQYIEGVMQSLQRPLKELQDDVVRDSRTNDHNIKVKILLSLQQLREHAVHLEAICDSILINSSLMRDL